MFTRERPFLSRLVCRESLCQGESGKEVYHLVLDLKDSGIRYTVGDSIGIYPENDEKEVAYLIQTLQANPQTPIIEKRTGETVTLEKYLATRANIHRARADSSMEILDLARDRTVALQDFCDSLLPLVPRLYSAASSMKSVGEEVHLAVALVTHETRSARRFGVCSHYLCHRVPLNTPQIPLFVHSHRGFTLPEDPNSAVIMIGAGTGIAPFRAFMQERLERKDQGSSWLFFGDWYITCNFFYRDFWEKLQEEGKLRLDVAFSRDQSEKVYVQHRMMEKGEELFHWIRNGAYIYVCGSALTLGKSVDQALLSLLQKYEKQSLEEAQNTLKAWRREKRYCLDIY